MTQLSLPDYKLGYLISGEKVKSWDADNLLNGYLIVIGSFQFPSTVNYPLYPVS
jgi:hypothetical protein